MRKSLLSNRYGRWLAGAGLVVLATPGAHAQLAGAKTIPGSYATLAAAIADLNAQGVGAGGVTFNIAAGYTETFASPTAGAITATGTAANPIVFQKAGTGANPIITAGVGTTTNLDAILSLAGSDYVTIDGLSLAENPANTTATQQAEFGIALFRAAATDGSQFNVIRNCVVTLNKANVGTIGIYGAPSAATAAAALTATATSGANSSNKVYGNVVSNALTGIYFAAGPATAIANYDQNNEIGVTAGNTIGNFGGTASGWGAGGTYQNGLKVAGNTLNSTLNYTSATASTPVAASTVTSTLRGIYTPNGTSASLDITNNTITLASGATTSQLSAIENGMGNTPAANTVTITGNTLATSTYATATSASTYLLYSTSSPATLNISNNTVSGNSIGGSSTGSATCYLIYNSGTPTTATFSGNVVTNNTAAGTSSLYLLQGGSATTLTLTNNRLTGNSKTGGTSTSGTLYCLAAGTAAVTATGNTVANNSVTATGTSSSTLYGYYDASSPTAETLTGNTFTDLSISGATTSTGSSLYGMYSNPIAATVKSWTQNTVGGLSLSPAGTVYGIYNLTGNTVDISRNKVYDLSAGTSSGVAHGIYISSGTTVTVANNLVGDLRAAASTSLLGMSGIYVGSPTTANLYYNTINLAASSTGATFGTSGIYFLTSPTTVDLRNNIVVNKSTAAGAGGYTAALRRVSGTANTVPVNLASTAGNNIYYAGTPSATNVIYVEGTTTATNAAQTLAAYKSLVSPREGASQTEDVAFLGTTGTAATFLHLNPAVPTQAESKAQPISSITVDFDNDTRNATTPDIGADEGSFTTAGAAVDLAAAGLVSPSTTGCYGAAESVVVSIRNNGTQAINFVTNPATVTVVVGGTATQTLTQTVSTGTLAVGATQNVTVGSLNMSAAGTYTFALTATAAGDGDTSNDGSTATRTKAALGAATQQLNFTGFNGSNLGTLYPGWYEATGAAQPTGTTSAWTSDDFANVTSGPNGIAAKINLYSNTRNEWLVSPRILATATSVLTYNLALTEFGDVTAATLGSDDRLEVRVSTDCGVTFSTVKAYTATTPISATGQSESVSLASYAGQEIIVAFFATDGTVVDTPDNDLFIDNINLNPPAIDLAAAALVSPTTGQGCYGTAESVVVSIRNAGTQAINFATNPATVTVVVSGAITQTLTQTVSTGTLAVGATQNVTVGPLNMSAAGTYTFALTATATGDQNTANDALLPTIARTVVAPVAGTIAPGTASLCVSGTVTLALSGAANGSIQWQQSADNVTFSDISGATSATYTTAVLTSTTYFRARTSCNAAVATSNVATVTVTNPQLTATNSPVAACAGSPATLTATASTGNAVRFFSAATGGTALATGGTYTTPALTATTTYYAEAFTGGTRTAGLADNSASNGTFAQPTFTDYPLGFAVTQAGTLTSVDVYPAAAGTLTIRLYSIAGTQPGGTATAVAGSNVIITVTAAQVGTRVTVPLNYTLAAGDYKLSNPTGTLGRYTTYTGTYPLTSADGVLSVKGSYNAATSTTYSNSTYNSFFNLSFTNECVGATRTAIQVIVTQPATASFSYPATGGNCAGSTGTVTATLATGATAGTFTASPATGLTLDAATGAVNLATSTAGTYTVTNTVAASGSCGAVSATATITVNPTPVRPTLTAAYNGTTTTLTSNAATGNQFYFNGVAIPGATGQTYVVNGSATTYGSYTVVVTNSFGCSSQASVASVVTTTRAGIAGASLLVYPNPTPTGQVTLELSGFRSATQLAVIDALGRVVSSQTLPATAGVVTHTLNLLGTAPGVYMLRLTNADGVETRRLVRE